LSSHDIDKLIDFVCISWCDLNNNHNSIRTYYGLYTVVQAVVAIGIVNNALLTVVVKARVASLVRIYLLRTC